MRDPRDDQALRAEVDRLKRFIRRQSVRLAANLFRARGLVDLYRSTSGPESRRMAMQRADVLRAAVVLLHASIEDFLKSMALVHLPSAPARCLDAIPIAGSDTQRPETFLLGRLAAHRGASVDNLIRASVQEYLDRITFNNTSDVVSLLTSIGADIERFKAHLPSLDPIMRRRHSIVHRADRVEERGSNKSRTLSISVDEVESWISVVEAFMIDAMAAVGFNQTTQFIEQRYRPSEDSA